MAMMRAHKLNVEQRIKTEQQQQISNNNPEKSNFLFQPIHKHVVKHEGRRTSLDPNWYTENIYSNQSIDNSDDDKIRKRFNAYSLDLNGNDDESDDLFIINLKPRGSPSKTIPSRYPKSNSCCFGPRASDRPNISKSHSFSTARGYDFPLEMSEFYRPPVKRSNLKNTNRYFEEEAHRRRLVDETWLADGPCPGTSRKVENRFRNYKATNEWGLDHNELFNDADIFSFDSDVASGGDLVHDNGLNQLFKAERSKIMLRDKFDKLNKYTDDFMDDYNKSFDDILRVTEYTSPNKNNIRLDIKPSKYDDSSSEVSTDTDLELDDFNFDFEKYWMDLEKNDDLDINRNTLTKKEVKSLKNVNVERYNNAMDNLNGNLDEIDSYDELTRKLEQSGIGDASYVNDEAETPFDKYRDTVGRSHRFSLLNNIFSIYKPNKYSPLNCQQSMIDKNNRLKSLKLAKKINRSSRLRPLGESSANRPPVFISSCNRPLMITSSPPFLPSPHPTRDQARFQIIPEKTGLKISPLYRLDYEHGLNNRKHKYNYLKSTTRPLTFW
ncbi:uncharacterized protein LOC134829613 [Culicoides brevitarsis]|uniref:uncharacterized protein LOC134829613 n=1 Tax=Culicoides brevitarsis TaxID=469753 RepID=UPI00307B9DE9